MPLSDKTREILLKIYKTPEIGINLFVNSHIGFVIGERETGKFLVVNDTFVQMTGYSRKELLNMCYRDIVPEDAVEWIRTVVMAKLENEGFSDIFEKRIMRKNGGQLWLQSRSFKIDDHIFLSKEIDETEMKIKEAELIRALNIKKQSLPDSLSGSEREVARLAASGLSSKEISDKLNIAPRTVDNHRSRIRKKLQVKHNCTLRDALHQYITENRI